MFQITSEKNSEKKQIIKHARYQEDNKVNMQQS